MTLDSDCDWLLPAESSDVAQDRPGAGGVMPDPLAALLAAVAAGDRAAFRQLYDATSPKLMGVALRLLRHRPVAEDALQEAYLRIWSKAGQFAPARGRALPWLAQIVRNTALDQIKRRGTAHDDLADHAEHLADGATPVGTRLDLDGAFAALGPQQRDAVLLSYLHGYTNEELAERIGAPLGTAKTWVRRGAERLRQRLSA